MQKRVMWGGLILIVGVAAATAVSFFTTKPSLRGAVIDPPLPAAQIQLEDFNAQSFSLSGVRGNIVLLYFGYTNCPDECPLTMAHLKLAVDQLGNDSQRVRVVMITTDPKRDDAQVMKAFLGKFSAGFIGLVGTQDQLAKVWKDYGVTVEDNGETHSYFIYLIDQAGNFRETFLPDSQPSDIAADVRLLLSER